MKSKLKVCDQCTIKFTPQRPFQRVCSSKCAFAQDRKKKAEKPAQKPKEAKEKALKHSDWINLLQIVFNAWIRQRDKGQQCITCETKAPGEYHAGHCYSVSRAPELRFHEDNVHLQCRHCNIDLDGRFEDYKVILPFRVGYQRFKALEEARNTELKLSIPEIKEKITHYRSLTTHLARYVKKEKSLLTN